ncbi:AraC family transcriptional regulator [soil metagenome]
MSSYCRRENHVLETGTVLLLNPGEIHAPAPADSGGWSFRMFYLDKELFQSTSLNLSMQDLLFQQPFVQDNELASNLLQLHLDLEGSGDRLHFESILVSIFSRLAERHSEAMRPPNQPKPDQVRINRARQYLEAHYDQNLSLAELAEVSSFSSSHFLRMFRDTVGLTPHAYLTQVRIEFATSLLRAGTPLVDVANQVGFTDQSHFTKRFKGILGVTPGQYSLNARPARKAGERGPTQSRRHWNTFEQQSVS